VDLKGKVALVTGGGTGLGLAISTLLAARGCAVAVNYPGANEQAAREAAAALRTRGVESEAVRADVSSEAEVTAMVAEVVARFGRLDVLVNNAGTTVFVPVTDLEGMRPDDWDRIMAVNVKGTYLVSRAAATHLRASGNGAIVNTASVSGLRVYGSCMAYSVSKAGILHLTRWLAVALAPAVRVNALAPGFMDTGWYPTRPDVEERAARTLLARIPQVDDIAAMALALIENDSVTGHTAVIDAGALLR
jgi:NAD(P)-dependent dehydrogenase (short-subunit alcohol dehydrogenase family)